MAREKRDKRELVINIHLPEGSVVNVVGGTDGTTEGNDEIMAKIDEVQASLDELDTAVREFLSNAGGSVAQLQQELANLRADDAVEDTKLDGMKNAIQNITQAIKGLSQTEPPAGGDPYPDQTLPGDLPIPSHPIYYPLPPGGVIDNTLPGDQPYPDQGLPGSQPRPDQGLPGSQPRPDQGLPGDQPKPSHPIVLPPDSGGWLPVYIWGPNDPRPGTGLPGEQPKPDQGLPGSQPHPDQGLPPIPPPTEEEKAHVEWKAMWTPTTGWVSFAIVVPGGSANVPTPSKRAK